MIVRPGQGQMYWRTAPPDDVRKVLTASTKRNRGSRGRNYPPAANTENDSVASQHRSKLQAHADGRVDVVGVKIAADQPAASLRIHQAAINYETLEGRIFDHRGQALLRAGAL